ncbi:hypothetical protein BJX76DRAFT_183036 [Aspergillus varians]
MISANPEIESKMSQAAAAAFPAPASAKDQDYAMQGHPMNCQNTLSKQYVPGLTGVGNPWAPPAQGMISGYSLCDATPSADTTGSSYDSLLNYERLFQSNIPILDDDFTLNFQIPCLDPSPSAEEPSATTVLNTKGPVSLPIQMPPSQSRPSPYPVQLPTDRACLNLELLSARGRRRSAPELNMSPDAERRQKHANRRASHNIVEKRYRMNLNSKFRQLEYAINKGADPCFSSASSPSSSSPKNMNNTTTPPSPSANNEFSGRRQQSPKASIIDSALSFIESLKTENHVLKGKLDLYETPPNSSRFHGHSHGHGHGHGNGNGNGPDGLKSVKLEK